MTEAGAFEPILARLREIMSWPEAAARMVITEILDDTGVEPGLIEILAKFGTPPPDGAMADKLHPQTVAALIFLVGHRPNDAIECLALALRDGQQDLATQKLTAACRANLTAGAIFNIRRCRPGDARYTLARLKSLLGDFLPCLAETTLLTMMDHLDALSPDAPGPWPVEGRPSLISLPVWGEHFIESAGRAILSCLRAAGNVPELARRGTVILRFATLDRDIDRLYGLAAVQALMQYARVEIVPFPSAVGSIFDMPDLFPRNQWSRLMEGFTDHETTMLSRRLGADRFQLGADTIVPHRFLGAIKDILEHGYEMVGGIGVRSLAAPLLSRAAEDGWVKDGVMDVPADWLYRVAIEEAHPHLQRCFARRGEPNTITASPVNLLTRAPGGFAIHGFQIAMLSHSGRAVPRDLVYSLHSADVRLFADFLQHVPRDRIYLPSLAAGDLFVTSLDSVESFSNFGTFSVSASAALDTAITSVAWPRDLAVYDFFFRHAFQCPLPRDLADFVPEDALSSAELIEQWDQALARAAPGFKGP